MNDGFTTLCGFARQDLLGKNITQVIPAPHAAQHDAYLERYARTRQPRIIGQRQRKVHLKHKDGSLVLISLEARASLPASSPYISFLSQVTSFEHEGELFFRGRIARMNKRVGSALGIRKGLWCSSSRPSAHLIRRVCR